MPAVLEHNDVISPRKKSPRGPTMDLREALERTLKAYDKEGRHEAPADVMAQNIGYSNAKSGAAAQALASISYFGLINRTAIGMAVSKEAEEYKFSPDENLKQTLLRRWLRTPVLYSEFLDKFPNGLPSDGTLKFEFIKKGFNAKIADSYVKTFKESIGFARYYDLKTDEVKLPALELPSTLEQPGVLNKPDVLPIHKPDGHDVIPVRLSGGRKANLVIPSPFYEADKAILKAHIDIIYTETTEQDV